MCYYFGNWSTWNSKRDLSCSVDKTLGSSQSCDETLDPVNVFWSEIFITIFKKPISQNWGIVQRYLNVQHWCSQWCLPAMQVILNLVLPTLNVEITMPWWHCLRQTCSGELTNLQQNGPLVQIMVESQLRTESIHAWIFPGPEPWWQMASVGDWYISTERRANID